MRVLRRLMNLLRRHAAPADPQLMTTRRRLDVAEHRLAGKLNVSIDELRENYDRGDHLLGRR